MPTTPDPFAGALREALDAERGDDDDALIARAIGRATARLEATGAIVSGSVDARPLVQRGQEASLSARAPAARSSVRALGSRSRTRLLRVGIPLAAAFAASIALAAFQLASRSPVVPAAPIETPEPPPVTTVDSPRREAVTNMPAETPSVSVNDLPSAKPSAVVTTLMPQSPRAESNVTAAELFRDANAERRAGNIGPSMELYGALQKRFPDAPETHASRVSLGRLLLDRKGDATGALEQFDAYLRSQPGGGTLAEEARVGRALAFQRLGQPDAERRAWEELIARHPQSLHAARATERLHALDGSREGTAP